MPAPASLEDEISATFNRACHERDWEIAEYLFQALEAIARRDGDDHRVECAFERLVREFSSQPH